MDLLLEIIRKPERLADYRLTASSFFSEITRIPDEIRYLDFFVDHLIPNKPCVFGPWLTADWKCRREWRRRGGGGGGGDDAVERSRDDEEGLKEKVSGGSKDEIIDYAALSRLFGEATVPVANCKSRRYDAQTKTDWKFDDYLDYLRAFPGQKPEEAEVLYCKDWHLCRDFPDYRPYETPSFFRSDWLNRYYDNLDSDDYRFVYLGPSSSWTPFHADVLRSYSWSCNVVGAKSWILFVKGEEESLRDVRGNLPFDVRNVEYGDTPPSPPSPSRGRRVFQYPGETIFVPSGWHHQVHNVSWNSGDAAMAATAATVSVNHNWLNGCNVDLAWNHLQNCLRDVKRAINDCSDMDGFSTQCQLILKANEGMNFKDFFHFLRLIASPMMNRLVNGEQQRFATVFDEESNHHFGTTRISRYDESAAFEPGSALHNLFDLSRISHCLKLMTTDDDFNAEMERDDAFTEFTEDVERMMDKHVR